MSRRINQRVKENGRPSTLGDNIPEAQWRKMEKATGTCRCGEPKKQRWHLACEACWALVPAPLQTKVYRLYKQRPGSGAHIEAVREAHEAIRKARKLTSTPEQTNTDKTNP